MSGSGLAWWETSDRSTRHMGKKVSFPHVLSIRLSGDDAIWLTKRAQSLRLTDSSFARILIGIGIESVQKNPGLVLAGGSDSD